MKIDARTWLVGLVIFSACAFPAVAALPAFRIVEHIKVPDGRFDYATFDSASKRILMARPEFTTVIDAQTGALSQLEAASGGHMALPLPGTTHLLVTQGQPGIARIVDAATDTVLADIPVGENPDGAVYDSYSNLVFVMNHTSGDANVIDPIAMKSLATISIGGTLEFAVTNGTGKIFVNVEDQNRIAVIDVATRSVSARYDMPGCEEPTGLAYDMPTNLLISSCEGIAKVLDADTGEEIASLTIGDGADAVIYDGGRRVIFIPCGQSGELDVISLEDASRISVVQRLPTAVGSRTGIVDTDTGRVYMLSSKPDPASLPGGRVGRLAGSYEVLVVGP